MPSPLRTLIHSRHWLWLLFGAGIILLGSVVWLLYHQQSQSLQLLQQQRLESRAYLFTTHFDQRASAYVNYLQSLRERLAANPQMNQGSFMQMALVSGNREMGFASARNIRIITLADYAQLKVNAAETGRTGAQTLEAVAQQDMLTIISPLNQRLGPDPEQNYGVAMDIKVSSLLSEVIATSGLQNIRIEAQLAPANKAERQLPADQLYYNKNINLFGLPFLFHFTANASLLHPSEAQSQWPGYVMATLAFLLFGFGVALTLMEQKRTNALVGELQEMSKRSNLRLDIMAQQPMIAMAELDAQSGQFLSVTPHYAKMLGYQQQEMLMLTFQSVTQEDDARRAQLPALPPAPDEEPPPALSVQRVQHIHKDGSAVWVSLMCIRNWPSERLIQFPALQHCALIIALDLNAETVLEGELQRNIGRNRHVLQHLPVGICIVDNQWRVEFANNQFRAISLLEQRALPSFETWWQHILPNSRHRQHLESRWRDHCTKAMARNGVIERLEIAVTTSGGMSKTLELSGIILDNSMVFTLVDLSRHKQAEEEIRYLAFYDLLTGLPNRKLMLDRLQQALATSARHHWYGAVLVLDLDSFKSINDSRGPAFGDALLCEVAQRLRTLVPQDQTTSRIGGDEFVVILSALAEDEREAAQQCKTLGHKIMAAMREPFTVQGRSYYTSVSVGVTVFQGANNSPAELMRRADIALYQAKTSGRNTLQFFDPAMQAHAQARAALEADIRAGMALDQFMLYFQPQIDHERITGAEALLRWRDGDKGFVSPEKFISTAEESNLILPLGHWVLQQACKQLSLWAQSQDTEHLTLSVNVSPRQFKQESFVQQVISALAHTGAPANRLKLELTEGALLENMDAAVKRMTELRTYGVRFSLDDFGTGYSSLSHLQRLPISELKIDRSFIKDVLTSPNDASIVRGIAALGHSLGLRVVAEGVETVSQREFLLDNGCYAWQGYLAGKPMPLEEFEELLGNYINA